jgi:hypothetical protein
MAGMIDFADAIAAMKPTWKPGRNFKWLYVTHDGRIIGEVDEAMGGGEFYAEAGQKSLGRYYTEAQAKAAVEAAC